MVNDRFAGWVKETKALVDDANSLAKTTAGNWLFYTVVTKAVVYALLTIAIAIHEAAETKGKK